MELLGDVDNLKSHFGPFEDGVSVGVRKVHSFCQTYHRLKNHFVRTRWNSKVTRLKWKLVLVRLEIVSILTQDRCMVCAEHTMGSEIIFDAPNTPRRRDSTVSLFRSVWG
jgi:hypothetical protein